MTNRITLFAYGTLKKGFSNHEEYCKDAIRIESAEVWGRLYVLPAGFPALEISKQSIILKGTDDPLFDAQMQSEISLSENNFQKPAGDWELISGELITLPNPLKTLKKIDLLEGFSERMPSFYRRVLVSARKKDATITPAWLYFIKKAEDLCGERISKVWNEPLEDDWRYIK